MSLDHIRYQKQKNKNASENFKILRSKFQTGLNKKRINVEKIKPKIILVSEVRNYSSSEDMDSDEI